MLIACPECEHMVSDKAITCPNCGYPLTKRSSRRTAKPKRMRLPNGFGRITEIKGRNLRKPFRAMVTTGVDANGRPIGTLLKPVSYFETYNEAYAALVKYHESPYIFDSDITMEELHEKWLEARQDRVGESRLAAISASWKYCEPIKNKKVQEVRNRDIKILFETAKMTDKYGRVHILKGSMISRVRDLLSSMFDYAIEYEIVSVNPVKAVTIETPSEENSTHHIAYSDKEMEVLWQHVEDNFAAEFTVIQCYMGWRPSEQLDLRVNHVNLTDWYIIGGSKTASGKRRMVPIHERIRPLIRRRYDEVIKDGGEYLFEKNRGVVTYDHFKSPFRTMVKALSLNPKHLPHDARKHFITMAKKYGVDEYAIKRIVGHSIQDLTERVYTDRGIEWLHKEISKIP